MTRTSVRRWNAQNRPQSAAERSRHSRTSEVLNAPRDPVLAYEAPGFRVTFYVRQSEATFTTDPYRVADGFLTHRLGRKVVDGGPDVQRYLDRFLSDYLMLKGAGWTRYGQNDPHRTRDAYDEVREIIHERLTL